MLPPLDGRTARELHRVGWVELRDVASSHFGPCIGIGRSHCLRAQLSRYRCDLVSPAFARHPSPATPGWKSTKGLGTPPLVGADSIRPLSSTGPDDQTMSTGAPCLSNKLVATPGATHLIGGWSVVQRYRVNGGRHR